MIADMESDKILSAKVAELFLRGRKFNNSLLFTSKFYFKMLKTIKLNAAHYFVIKFSNKRNFNK